MRIEGYLFINYRGQYRFAVNMFAHDIGPVLESRQGVDHYWDVTMRCRPTLHELTNDQRVHIKNEFTPMIHEGLKEFRQVMQINPRANFKKTFEDGYIEFVNIG